MSRLQLSLVIPAYNEEANLARTVGDLQRVLRDEAILYEIVIVNDNSRDGTERVARELMQGDDAVRIVHRTPPSSFRLTSSSYRLTI